jgi:Leucine-rich repeat (LRR) protein
MKRKQLILVEMIAGVLIFVIAATVMGPKFLNTQNLNSPSIFPDAKFREQIARKLRKQPADRFTRADLLSIKELDVEHIGDFTGIRMFGNLERLRITYRDLTELTLPKLPNLIELNCSSNKLARIDVSRCNNLEVLDVSDNSLSELTLTGTPKLRELNCANNLLMTLDISEAPSLEWLDCSNNLLETVDTSKNPLLDSIYCSMNRIAELDLSKNPRLTKLTGWENPITELDVSHNTLLKVINMSRCGLLVMDFTHNQNLEVVVLSSNKLVDVPVFPPIIKLRMLYIDRNDLTEDDGKDVWKLCTQVPTCEYDPQKTELPERWAHSGPGIYSGVRNE